jgi:hypothetical protein
VTVRSPTTDDDHAASFLLSRFRWPVWYRSTPLSQFGPSLFGSG